MVLIKRYPNRKLYDTVAKQYISLEVIADLIQAGLEVKVLDHASGEDVTSIVLAQVIAELERKPGGFLPQSVLTGLIQAGGDTLATVRRTFANPRELLRIVDDEIERRLDQLVSRGVLGEEESHRLRGQLIERGQFAVGAVRGVGDELIERAVTRRRIPSRKDIYALSEKLDALTSQLEELTRSEKVISGRDGPS